MDREAWCVADHRVAKSWTWLSDWTELKRFRQELVLTQFYRWGNWDTDRSSTWQIQGSKPISLCIILVTRSLLSKISLCIVQAPPSQVLKVYFQTQKMGGGIRICLLWGSPVTECQSPCLSSVFPNQPLDVLTTLSPKLGTPESSINFRLASRHREPQEDWKTMKASEFSFDLWLRQCRPEQNSMGWSSVVLFLFRRWRSPTAAVRSKCLFLLEKTWVWCGEQSACHLYRTTGCSAPSTKNRLYSNINQPGAVSYQPDKSQCTIFSEILQILKLYSCDVPTALFFTFELIYDQPRQLLKSRDITLLTKVHLVKAVVFPVVICGFSIQKAECWRIDAFELWCWRRLLRVPWTTRRSNQSILKEISPEYSLEGLILKLQYFGHLMWRADTLEKTLMLGKTEGRRRRGWQDRMVGWHYQLDRHEFEWAPGVGDGQGSLACCSLWDHRESDTTERLNWTELMYLGAATR